MPEKPLVDYEKLKKILDSLPPDERQLLNVYNHIQNVLGYVPHEALDELAISFDRTDAEQQSLISFFQVYRSQPPAVHTVAVCYGTACYVRGAPLIYERIADELDLNEEGYSPDGSVCVEKVYCVGACSQAPLIMRDGDIVGRIKFHQTAGLVSAYKRRV